MSKKQACFDTDRSRVLHVYHQIRCAITEAEAGRIPFSAVFNHIAIRDCLPQYTVIATTWHIEDIRDRFPPSMPDDELFVILQEQARALENMAVRGGHEWFEWELPDARSEEDDQDNDRPHCSCLEQDHKEKSARLECGNCGFLLCEDCTSYSADCPNCQSKDVISLEK